MEKNTVWIFLPHLQSNGGDILGPLYLEKPWVPGDTVIKGLDHEGKVVTRKPNQVFYEFPKGYAVLPNGPFAGLAVKVPKVERNNNPKQVVMSRETYDELIARASWDIAPGNHIKRHIRKFNPHLKAERQLELVKELGEFKALKAKVYSIVNEYAGKTVFYKSNAGPIPVVLLGVGKGKTRLKCRTRAGQVIDFKVKDITIVDLVKEANACHT